MRLRAQRRQKRMRDKRCDSVGAALPAAPPSVICQGHAEEDM
jgi:hypothetical protein